MLSRRTFLMNAVGASLAGTPSAFSQTSHPLRMLILGGTGFIGPFFARAAVGRGHSVSVFNRGRSQADLPASVERLTGDRDGNMDAINARTWDAVLDLAAYTPRWVRSFGASMATRIRHYTFISTVMVYDHPGSRESTDENSPVLVYHGRSNPYELDVTTQAPDVRQYGALKVLCEQEAHSHFGAKALVLRSAYIVGPGDPQDQLVFIPELMRLSGAALMGGDAQMPAQFVDVRDLAYSAIRMIETGVSGTYNMVGPRQRISLSQLIEGARTLVGKRTPVTWVSPAWLDERPDREVWRHQIFWSLDSLESNGLAGIMRMSNARALKAGFEARDFRQSMADTLSWFQRQPAERQARLLGTRKSPSAGESSRPISWNEYREHENQALADWARANSVRPVPNSRARVQRP